MLVIYLIVFVSHLTSHSLNDCLGKRPLLSVHSKLAGFSDGNGYTTALFKMQYVAFLAVWLYEASAVIPTTNATSERFFQLCKELKHTVVMEICVKNFHIVKCFRNPIQLQKLNYLN